MIASYSCCLRDYESTQVRLLLPRLLGADAADPLWCCADLLQPSPLLSSAQAAEVRRFMIETTKSLSW